MTVPGPLSPDAAKALAHSAGEVAMLDVREHGQYGEGHPFLAVPCPFSRLELVAPALVPRLDVPILLVDDGDGIAQRSAAALGRLGYADVSWIEGGARAWQASGYTLFQGVNLPSKTLGELLEERWHVPQIDGDTLERWQRDGRPHHLFDGRPASEFAKMTIPGARSMPNGELPHRFAALVRDGTTPVVVHCAGRTRSLVGAAGLALAGIANPIYALENGTQGWTLSGRALRHGQSAPPLARLDEAAFAASAARAANALERHAIPRIDRAELLRLVEDRTRTLYLLDVRSAEEHRRETLADAVHAPAVQLVQATDQWIGVRRARVVLLDDTGLRGALTAIFLRALGYETHVLRIADAGDLSQAVPGLGVRQPEPSSVPQIDAGAAVALALEGAPLIDLRSSADYRSAHLEAAIWSIRPRLTDAVGPATGALMLIGDAGTVALAASDLTAAGLTDLYRVAGDVADWRRAALPLVSTPDQPSDGEAIDYLFFVHDRHDGNLEAARRYLAWEKGLVARLDEAEAAEYRIGPSPFPPQAA